MISQANSLINSALNSQGSSQPIVTTQYASGGEVKQTGPALVHQGEYVLNRNDVNQLMRNQQTPSINQPLYFDMRGAKIDKDTSKDLPRIIARTSRQALGRIGV
jgi:hypothetical protein